jgi:hypothetical protein
LLRISIFYNRKLNFKKSDKYFLYECMYKCNRAKSHMMKIKKQQQQQQRLFHRTNCIYILHLCMSSLRERVREKLLFKKRKSILTKNYNLKANLLSKNKAYSLNIPENTVFSTRCFFLLYYLCFI